MVAFPSPSLAAPLQPLGGLLFLHSLLKTCFPLGPVLNLLSIPYPLPGRFYSLPSFCLTLNKYKLITHKSLPLSQITFWGSRSICAPTYQTSPRENLPGPQILHLQDGNLLGSLLSQESGYLSAILSLLATSPTYPLITGPCQAGSLNISGHSPRSMSTTIMALALMPATASNVTFSHLSPTFWPGEIF